MSENINRELKVAWLFPDILYLHGERGNVLALKRIAKFANIEVIVDKVSYNSKEFEPDNYDVIFCPPGEIVSFDRIIKWLKPHKEALKKFIEDGKILLVTGTSQCIFGKTTVREDGSQLEGLGLIDCDYTERKYVYGDDIHFMTSYCKNEEECMGVQIQMMDVNSKEEPFGKLIYGFGNTGKDRNEGVLKNNSIFTNVLGPMLVQNPWITKKIVETAAINKGITIQNYDFNIEIEKKSIETKKAFIAKKKTNLTNC